MKAFFHTLGCKVNRYETEYMLLELTKAGFEATEIPDEADLILINSCTVTAESDRKTRQLVRRYRRLNSKAIILLTGCMPQAFLEEAKKLPADIILGNGSRRNVTAAVDKFLKSHCRVIEVTPHSKGEEYAGGNIESFSERTRAYMKIEDGCDRGCRYCIIPKARGRVRSRSLEDIYTEAKSLADAGFSELVLVGINLSSFGVDTGYNLADAVEAAASVEGIKRVRLGSLEPDLTDTAFLKRLAANEKFCPQFHLSLQSGCDETLKRMNRLYDSKFYKELAEEIRATFKNPSITTDIMVGFVGETEGEFNASLSFAENLGFLKAHIFPYSIRKGTAAAEMKGHIPEDIKAKRAAKMARVLENVTLNILKGLTDTTDEVLFEHKTGDFIVGHTKNFTEVFVKGDSSLLKTTKTVLIKEPFKTGVLAEVVK